MRQNLKFDPSGSKCRLRACPFLGTWRALLCGELLILERLLATCNVFFKVGRLGHQLAGEGQANRLRRIAVNRCFSAAADLKRSCRRERLEAIRCQR